ncbi:MAG: FAD-dependent monooxygenase, partial [Desulfatiglandales bacterium]|nr:FAD-dependent monooxygenase [Desulfatiglandales bacterium]
MKKCDVIIIGAGPAGTATALLLKKKGYQTILLEQAKFPRDKVCGEFISPAADSILKELGVLASIEAQSPLRLKGVFLSSYEESEMFVDYPDMPYSPGPVTSLSLPRTEFDNLMLEKVREAGVE